MKKPVKSLKKLSICRETVARLEREELSRIGGQLQAATALGDEWTGCLSDCTECGGGRTF